jgi:hypothetical protein
MSWRVLALGFAGVASVGSAFAQTMTPEVRLVEAFRTYCIETRAEPELVRAEVERTRSLLPKGVAKFTSGGSSDRWPGGSYDTMEVSNSIDPHDRMTVGFGGFYGGPGRRCEVTSSWGEIQKIVAALAAAGIADERSAVAFDGEIRPNDDHGRWKIRLGASEAVVELRGSTAKGMPGRSLTLTVGGQVAPSAPGRGQW